MLTFLIGKNKDEAVYHLLKKESVDFWCEEGQDLRIKVIQSLEALEGQYLFEGVGLFQSHEEENNTAKALIVGFDVDQLADIPEPWMEMLRLSDTNFFVPTGELHASAKKWLSRPDIFKQDLLSIPTKIKQAFIERYLQKNTISAATKIDSKTLYQFTKIDSIQTIKDYLDFLILGEVEDWGEALKQFEVAQTNVEKMLQLRFSLEDTRHVLELIYPFIHHADSLQLLYTIIFSRLKDSKKYSKLLQELVVADYLGKTKSNPLLWAKYWLYTGLTES